MIVIKGAFVQSLASDLTFRQRVEAFVKYHSTQVIGAFGVLWGAWEVMPENLKSDLFTELPILAKAKTPIYIAAFVIAYYKSRQGTQVVPVTPTAVQAPAATLPPPLVLVPAPAPASPAPAPSVIAAP